MPLKISIITPLHNKGLYIAETIESVLAQAVADWEMIIVENGSTDQGPAIAMQYAAKDSRVRFFEAPPNVRGPGAARNVGLGMASGEWILFLDADDLLDPKYMESQFDCAGRHPSADLLVGRTLDFREGQSKRVVREPAGWLADPQAAVNHAFACAPWPLHSTLVKRNLLPVPAWPEQCDRHLSEDSVFWFSLLQKGKVAWSPKAWVTYRLVGSEGRNEGSNIAVWIEAVIQIVRTNYALLKARGLTPTQSQCGHALRVLEERLWIARRTGFQEAADRAEAEAKVWLARIRKNSARILLRRLLGITRAIALEKAAARLGLFRPRRAAGLG